MGQILVSPKCHNSLLTFLDQKYPKSPYFGWGGDRKWHDQPDNISYQPDNLLYHSNNLPSTNCWPYLPRITSFWPEKVIFWPKNTLRFGPFGRFQKWPKKGLFVDLGQEMVQNGPILSKMIRTNPNYSKYVQKLSKMVQKVSNMLPNGKNGQKPSQMVPNGPKTKVFVEQPRLHRVC